MSDSEPARNLAAFWLLGLCNNFAYVIMLSAAHDILHEQEGNSNSTLHNSTLPGNSPSSTAEAGNTSGNNSHLVEYCNPIGTGAILLADILPTLIIKLFAPFFIQKISYVLKVGAVVVFAAASFPIVAVSQAVSISILGVIFASASGGLGEITFLSLSSFYDKNTVSTWSSGTGAAGVFGALSYAGFTAVGLSPRNTLFIMLVVPAILALSFFVLLKRPSSDYILMCPTQDERSLLIEEAENHDEDEKYPKRKKSTSLLEKIKMIKPLLKYMIPLGLVYVAEYFINQALFELIYFKNIWLPVNQQYRWYQVIYQIGVLISRSSVNLFVINKLWLLPILQWINIGVLLAQVFTGFIPSIWIVFVIILYEGLLGGFAYVNTFYKISKEVEEDKREFSMGVTSVSDSMGIALAGFISIPIHNLICSL